MTQLLYGSPPVQPAGIVRQWFPAYVVPVGQPAAIYGLNYLLTVLKTQNIFYPYVRSKAYEFAVSTWLFLHLFTSLGVNATTLVPVSKEFPVQAPTLSFPLARQP
jgi:hypothetical protein